MSERHLADLLWQVMRMATNARAVGCAAADEDRSVARAVACAARAFLLDRLFIDLSCTSDIVMLQVSEKMKGPSIFLALMLLSTPLESELSVTKE
jgi:hypothetical protein